jgi:hypothetical protein
MIASLKNNIKIINGTGIYVMDSQIHDEKIEEMFLSLADAIIEVAPSESKTTRAWSSVLFKAIETQYQQY